MTTEVLETTELDPQIEATVKEIYEFAIKWFKIKLRPHQLDILRFILSGGEFVLFLLPRGHGKTTVIFIYLTWCICKNPKIRIMIIANTDELASDISRNIKYAIENNAALRAEYGLEMGKPWKLKECFFEGELHPVLNAAATQARVTGKRFDMCLMDDAVEKELATQAQMRKFTAWVHGQLFFAIDPKDEKIIVVGTRKGVNDWYSQLLQNPDIASHVGQAILEDGTPLWDIDEEGRGYSLAKLAKMRRRDPRQFAQEMMNQPAPPKGYRFDPDDLQIYEALPPSQFLTWFLGIDPGHGLGDRATYFAMTVVAVDSRNQNTYIVEQFRDRIELIEQVAKAKQFYEKYEPEDTIVESVFDSYGYMAAEFMRVCPESRDVDYIHKKLQGTTEKSKELRIESRLGPLLREKKIFIRDPEKDHFADIFITHEYLEFGGGGATGKGSDMDLLDSLVLAIDDIVYEYDDSDDISIAVAGTARSYAPSS